MKWWRHGGETAIERHGNSLSKRSRAPRRQSLLYSFATPLPTAERSNRVANPNGGGQNVRDNGGAMQDEAEITISGVKLTHEESMTVRVAIDTLANVLAEGLEDPETEALTGLYLKSLTRIQTLLESRQPRKQ